MKHHSLSIIPLHHKLTGLDLAQAFKDVCLLEWHPAIQKRPILQDLANLLADSYCKDVSAHTPIHTALKWIALAAEQSPKKSRNAYHNPLHTAQVAMMTAYFCAQAKVNEKDYLKSLCAAFGHDINHPGKPNPADDKTYNEREAAKVTTDIMDFYNVDAESVADVKVMILSTSPNGPHSYVAHMAEATRKKLIPTMKPVIPEQLRLLENPALTELSAILCDADIFLSAGTNDRLMTLAGRLLNNEARQAGQKVNFNTPQSRMAFFDHIVGKKGFSSTIARELANGNYKKLRRNTLQAVKKAQA